MKTRTPMASAQKTIGFNVKNQNWKGKDWNETSSLFLVFLGFRNKSKQGGRDGKRSSTYNAGASLRKNFDNAKNKTCLFIWFFPPKVLSI